ncbi:MAG: cryptochrome/photolyase family protein [Actinomycetota bacterium]
MTVGIVALTRDLRVHDHPALAAAVAEHDAVGVLFVVDERVAEVGFRPANRAAFLVESLADLDASLRDRSNHLVVRHGTWHEEILRVAADTGATVVHCSDDVSAFARRRIDRLRSAAAPVGVEVRTHHGVTVLPAGAVRPTGGDHFKVFTPYYRQWLEAPWRPMASTPRRIPVVDGLEPGPLPVLEDLATGPTSPARVAGGETAARARFTVWRRHGLAGYGDAHDDLPGAATSQVAAYLHLGCLSPLELAIGARGREGAEPWVRQLCWRDFYHQVLAARPDASWADFKHRNDPWIEDDAGLAAWKTGRTGFPVVDAAMRQLLHEGYMHNRARMIVASFLTKDLGIDWRVGARHFLEWLTDGDLANNNLNWQWTAGTGTDTNPHRIFNPTVQGQRFDPKGVYVRRYVEELADVPGGGSVHTLGPLERAAVGYPDPILDHHEAIAEYRARRGV